MTKEEVLAKVQEIAAEQLDVDKEEIVLTANIKDDLDVFEIMNELEDSFDIQLDADEGIQTIGDVVDYVQKQLESKD